MKLVLCALVCVACRGGQWDPPVRRAPGGDPSRGEQAIQNYGCGGCHSIPGVRGARGKVASPLDSFSQRTFIDGRLPNSSDNLVRWLVNPRAVDPETAMPTLGLTQTDARDVAAYLYTLD